MLKRTGRKYQLVHHQLVHINYCKTVFCAWFLSKQTWSEFWKVKFRKRTPRSFLILKNLRPNVSRNKVKTKNEEGGNSLSIFFRFLFKRGLEKEWFIKICKISENPLKINRSLELCMQRLNWTESEYWMRKRRKLQSVLRSLVDFAQFGYVIF